jgi:integrase
MPRTVRDARLETRTARSRLPEQAWPHYRELDPELHLGYRKPPGVWVRRRRDKDAKRYITETIGIADDTSTADGREVLNYVQAQHRARSYRQAQGQAGFTVSDALDAYLGHLESEGRPANAIRDARYRIDGFIRPKLGKVELTALTADRLRRWRDELVKTPPRLRTAPGRPQKHDVTADDIRARQATVNRIRAVLIAALNRAFEDGRIDSDKTWRRLKPFRNVDVARVRYLSRAEAQRLDNAVDPEFRPLLRAALFSGARYGALAALRVDDFNRDAGTLRLTSRKGRGREKVFHVPLSDAAKEFFTQQTAGRSGAELMLVRVDGSQFGHSHQVRPMNEASARAGISPPATFHTIRHTWASLSIMAGMPLLVAARALGHSDTRMVEKHYGHLAPSYMADAIRAGAPDFQLKTDRTIAPLS